MQADMHSLLCPAYFRICVSLCNASIICIIAFIHDIHSLCERIAFMHQVQKARWLRITNRRKMRKEIAHWHRVANTNNRSKEKRELTDIVLPKTYATQAKCEIKKHNDFTLLKICATKEKCENKGLTHFCIAKMQATENLKKKELIA